MGNFMKIAVIGGGSWGTALAMVANRASHDVVIHSRNHKICDEINQSHTNSHYLPGIILAKEIIAHKDLAKILDSDALLLAIPAQNIYQLCLELKELKLDSNCSNFDFDATSKSETKDELIGVDNTGKVRSHEDLGNDCKNLINKICSNQDLGPGKLKIKKNSCAADLFADNRINFTPVKLKLPKGNFLGSTVKLYKDARLTSIAQFPVYQPTKTSKKIEDKDFQDNFECHWSEPPNQTKSFTLMGAEGIPICRGAARCTDKRDLLFPNQKLTPEGRKGQLNAWLAKAGLPSVDDLNSKDERLQHGRVWNNQTGIRFRISNDNYDKLLKYRENQLDQNKNLKKDAQIYTGEAGSGFSAKNDFQKFGYLDKAGIVFGKDNGVPYKVNFFNNIEKFNWEASEDIRSYMQNDNLPALKDLYQNMGMTNFEQTLAIIPDVGANADGCIDMERLAVPENVSVQTKATISAAIKDAKEYNQILAQMGNKEFPGCLTAETVHKTKQFVSHKFTKEGINHFVNTNVWEDAIQKGRSYLANRDDKINDLNSDKLLLFSSQKALDEIKADRSACYPAAKGVVLVESNNDAMLRCQKQFFDLKSKIAKSLHDNQDSKKGFKTANIVTNPSPITCTLGTKNQSCDAVDPVDCLLDDSIIFESNGQKRTNENNRIEIENQTKGAVRGQ